jgi:hypothetical protein
MKDLRYPIRVKAENSPAPKRRLGAIAPSLCFGDRIARRDEGENRMLHLPVR